MKKYIMMLICDNLHCDPYGVKKSGGGKQKIGIEIFLLSYLGNKKYSRC